MKELLKNEKKRAMLIKLIACAVVLVICTLFARRKFYALIMCLICIYTIATTGLDLLFGYSGQISFGQAGFYAIGAYSSALLTVRAGLTPIPAMLIGALISVLISLVIAIPAVQLRKHFLSMLTIAFNQIVVTFANSVKFTGGANGFSNIPPISLFGYVLDSRRKNLVFLALVMVLVMFIKQRIIESRTGRAFIAIKENPVAAQGMGINIRFYKTMAIAIAACLASIAGSFFAHVMGYIGPESFATVQSTLFVTVLLFGGIGSLLGPIIGAACILPIRELFQSFVRYQGLIYAVFIVAALFFFPLGLVGLFDKFRIWIRRRKGAGSNA